MLTVGSLFSGIGGLDLGLERAGMRVVWQCEVDPYASRVLKKHWPNVPNLGDITKVDFTKVEPVDVLCGGFPCQNISSAGRKEGIGGKKSGLWTEYARAIGDLRPRYVIVENVRDLLVRGFGVVLGELAALGYDAEWDCIPAAAIGAPHIRDRIFIVAHRHDKRFAECNIFPKTRLPTQQRNNVNGLDLAERGPWVRLPDLLRVDAGVPARVDRLRGLGNAVVPQVAELIGGWIVAHAAAQHSTRKAA